MGTWKGRGGTASKVLRNTFSSMICTLPVSALRGQCCGCVIDVRGVLVVWDGCRHDRRSGDPRQKSGDNQCLSLITNPTPPF